MSEIKKNSASENGLQINEWITQESRGEIYSFLSASFRDEPKEPVAVFLNGSMEAVFRLLDTVTQTESETLRSAFQNLGKIFNKDSEDILSLRREFALLFLNPRGVHPYESVYRGSRKQLMDKPWVQVKDFYESVGLKKGDNEEHPEDHASVELGFMAHLAFMGTGEDSQDPDKDLIRQQYDFLDRHLLQWMPQLCQDMRALKFSSFYSCLSQITENWLVLDHQILEKALEHKGG